MSVLVDLLQFLCPNGVPFMPLGVIAQIGTGSSNGNEADEVGKYPFFVRSQTIKAKNTFEFDEEAIIIPGEGGVGDIFHYVNGKYALHQRVYRIHITTDTVNSRFAYYYMEAYFKSFILRKAVIATVSSIRKPMIESFCIPVPPLPVQNEIVRILDNFKGLIEELTAELTARKKQYEFYCNKLFSDASSIIVTTLDKISENFDNMRKPVTSGKREPGKIPYYGASGIVDYVKDYIFNGDYLLISEDGANLLARNTPIAFSISGKTWVNNHAHILKFSEYATRRYVEMYLNSINLSFYITGAAQPKLNQENLNKIEIPLPPLGEQKRIVAILDRFDALCNDISVGLPAEIAARQKQYEYFRDKFLTFKELGA